MNLRLLRSTSAANRVISAARLRLLTPCLIALPLSLIAPSGAAAQQPSPTSHLASQTSTAAYGKLPLSFEPNQGQTDPQVQFLSRGPGYSLFLTPGEALLELQKTHSPAAEASILRMTLLGADAKAPVQGEDKLPGIASYFHGSDPTRWKTSIPTFKRVSYKAVYPGVDLVFYGNQRELEYDFVVAPGADPSHIALGFTGGKPTIDTANGDLVLTLSEGETRFHKPVVYQLDGRRRIPVEATYTLAGNEVRFALGTYDTSKELVIDPVLSYLSYIGGSSQDLFNGIAVDGSGSAYTVATTYSADYPLKTPYESTNPALAIDTRRPAIAVSKFNATGTALVYSTYLDGTTYGSFGNAIAVDSGGNAYVAGYSFDNTYPITPGAYLPYCNNGYDPAPGGTLIRDGNCGYSDSGTLTKLNPTGTGLVYSTFLSGNNSTVISAVAVDAAGQAYVTGNSYSSCGPGPYAANGYGCQAFSNFPITAGSAQSSSDTSITGGGYAFLTKFNAAGSALLYSSILGTSSSGLAVAVDASGNAYIGGSIANAYTYTLLTTPGAFQPSTGSTGLRGFVAKFDTVAQKLIYSTYLNGTTPTSNVGESVTGIAADSAGNAYVTGYTSECTFPVTPGAFQTQGAFPASSGGTCGAGFVTKLNPTGSALVWSTFLGNAAALSTNTASLNALALGSDNSVYVAGRVDGLNFSTVNPVQTQTDYNAKATISHLNPAGSALLFSTTLGSVGTGFEYATGLAVDPSGNMYVVGKTTSTTLPVTAGAFQTTNPAGGNYTGFVAKIAPFASSTTALTLPTGTVTAGTSVKLTAKVTPQTGVTTIPTGTLTFLSGTSTLGTGTLDTTGTASFTASSLNGTTYSLTASYSGDSLFTASTSAAQNLVVTPATPTVTLTVPATATLGTAVKLSVTVAATSGTPSGTVTFKDGTTTLGTATLASGTASYTTSTLAVATHSITASYGGDAIFASATSTAQSVVISLAAPTVTLTAPTTALVGAAVNLSVALTATSGTPTGTVIFKDGTTTLGTATLASGAASYSTTALAAGAHSITASYSGDTNFAAAVSATSTVTITVAPAITFAALPTSLTIVHGSSGSVAITGTRVGGYTGTVTFSCSTLPTAATCSFSPSSLTFTSSSTALSSTLTISTLTSATLDRPTFGKTSGGTFFAFLLLPMGWVAKNRKRIRPALFLLFAVAISSIGLMTLSGCSSSTTSTGTSTTTPAGSYTITVNASATAGATTINIPVTVQ